VARISGTHRGVSKHELAGKSLGHNLTNLLQSALAKGLDSLVQIGAQEVKEIATATTFYDSGQAGRRFQYFNIGMAMRGFTGLPDLAVLQGLAKSLVDNKILEDKYLSA
jgi:hypothetical protein